VAVESAVEVHHGPRGALRGVPDDDDGAAQIEIDGLLTQHGDASVGGTAQVLGVRVGGGRDEDRVDRVAVKGRRDVGEGGGAVRVGQRLGTSVVRVVDAHEIDVAVGDEVRRVDR